MFLLTHFAFFALQKHTRFILKKMKNAIKIVNIESTGKVTSKK